MLGSAFHIIVPYNCNASCEFCTHIKCKNPLKLKNWFKKLAFVIECMPSTIKSTIITGGEPSLFPDLGEVIKMTNNTHTILETNATGFIKGIPTEVLMGIDQVNIIRNGISDHANRLMFKCDDVPTTEQLKSIIEQLQHVAVKVNITKLISHQHSNTKFLENYFKYVSDELGIDNVIINKVRGTLVPSVSEQELCMDHSYKTVTSAYTKHKMVNYNMNGVNVNVTFISDLGTVPKVGCNYYFHPNGLLTKDIRGSEIVNPSSLITPASEEEDDRAEKKWGLWG